MLTTVYKSFQEGVNPVLEEFATWFITNLIFLQLAGNIFIYLQRFPPGSKKLQLVMQQKVDLKNCYREGAAAGALCL